jgi:NADPH2:quinone reductase
MRSWQLAAPGEPAEQLHIVEGPEPDVTPGNLLVATRAVGLSFPDVLMCRGEYQISTPADFTPGGETSGEVIAVGDGADFEVGQRIMTLGGGLADVVSVNAASSWVLPDNLSFAKAAALPVNYGTTWFALHDRAHVQAGEWLLITGAAGGTGTAAVQLGQSAGAKICAIAGGADKTALLNDLGCDVVIDHRETPAWVDAVRTATGGGVDVAYDPVGGDTFHQVRRCMNWDGRLLVIGFVDSIADAPTNHALLKNYSIVGVHWGASLGRNPASLDKQMTSILALAAAGAVDPPLFPPYDFESGAQAIQDIADRVAFGKVVVEFG